jgi:hypothetical protein
VEAEDTAAHLAWLPWLQGVTYKGRRQAEAVDKIQKVKFASQPASQSVMFKIRELNSFRAMS